MNQIEINYRKLIEIRLINEIQKLNLPNGMGSSSFLIDEQSSRIRIRYMIILKLADIEVPNNECCEFIISLLSLG